MQKAVLKRFGLNLKRLRTLQGLTQERLAELSGLHPNYIGGIERGERKLSLANIVRLCLALQCSATELFKDVIGADGLRSKGRGR